MRTRLIASGYGLLLVCAYFDNVRGPLLPILKQTLDLSYSQTSAFLVAGYCAALVGNLSLFPLLKRFGERTVTLSLCGYAIVTCGIGFAVSGLASALALGVFIGSTVSTFGVMCNVLVLRGSRPSEQAKTLCGLHAMYGLGSLVAPLALSELVSQGIHWPWILAIFPPFVIAAIVGIVVGIREPAAETELPPEPTHLTRQQALILLSLALYVAGEVAVSMWLSPYLVATEGMKVERTAPYVSGFFLMMAVSRLVWFFRLRQDWERPVLIASLVVPAALVAIGHQGSPLAFSASGVMGGFFPVFLGRVSHRFPAQWRNLTIWSLVAVQVALIACHATVGRLADRFGIELAYWMPVAMLLLSTGALLAYFAGEERAPEIAHSPV